MIFFIFYLHIFHFLYFTKKQCKKITFTSESFEVIQTRYVIEYQIWWLTILSKDPVSRVACETLTTTNEVILAGETRGLKINKEELIENVRSCIKDIGYDQKGFSWKTANIETHLHEQSTDIAMGVTQRIIKMKELATKVLCLLCL